MYDIIVGRSEADREKFGDKGTVLIGRHYVKMGRTTSLSNNIFIDVTRSHVFFIVGKRGSGKSYTMGVIAEGISDLPSEIKNNISIVLLDTMGIYWTMKYPNQKDKLLLNEWGLKAKSLDVKIFTPSGYFDDFRKKGIPTDFPFSIKPSELDAGDWCTTFETKPNEPLGVLIEKVIYQLKDDLEEKEKDYNISDIMAAIAADKDADATAKNAAKNLFMNAMNWGIFEDENVSDVGFEPKSDTKNSINTSAKNTAKNNTKNSSKSSSKDLFNEYSDSSKSDDKNADKNLHHYKATPLSELAKGGQVTVLDLSCYSTMPNSWGIKNLVAGLIAEKLFIQRMLARKDEEYQTIHKATNLFGDESVKKFDFPMVWLVIDEAHEFLPHDGKTLATDPLVTILREGRQPGISLILATQQPGKIHTDVMTQSDVVIAHRITAKIDTDALAALMQSYMREGLVEQLDNLPRSKGSAIIFDDNNEKMYPMRMRPRFTWHGGEDPSAIPKKDDLDDNELSL